MSDNQASMTTFSLVIFAFGAGAMCASLIAVMVWPNDGTVAKIVVDEAGVHIDTNTPPQK